MCERCKEYRSLSQIVTEECFICEGTGECLDENEFLRKCPVCDGEGQVLVKLRQCPNCERIVASIDTLMVNDRYGIPYQRVCVDCYESTKQYIMEWEFDESYAGETLEEDNEYYEGWWD